MTLLTNCVSSFDRLLVWGMSLVIGGQYVGLPEPGFLRERRPAFWRIELNGGLILGKFFRG